MTALVTAALAPAHASGQSLADIARKEQERRKQIKTPSKVYTNEDLRDGGEPSLPLPAPEKPAEPVSAAQEPPAAPDAPEVAGDEPEIEDPEKTETYWRERITAVRQQLARSQLFLEALQNRVNGLWADFTARDDPAQRAVIEQDRQKALAEMERVRQEIEQYTKEIAEIEEEARRAGVPPGWLR